MGEDAGSKIGRPRLRHRKPFILRRRVGLSRLAGSSVFRLGVILT